MKNLKLALRLFRAFFAIFFSFAILACENISDDLSEILEDDVTTSYTVYIDNPEDVVSPRSTVLALKIGRYYSASELISLCSESLVRTGYKISSLRYWNNPYTSVSLASSVPYYISTVGGTIDGDIVSLTVSPDAAALYVNEWEKIKYSVCFAGNGGKTSDTWETLRYNTSTFEYDESGTLDSNTDVLKFYRNGYDFNGWNTSANGSGTAYSDGATVENLSATDGTVVYLYAQWKARGCVSQIDDGLNVTYSGTSGMTFTSLVGAGFWFVNGTPLSTTALTSITINYSAYDSGSTYILYFISGNQPYSATFTIPIP